MNEDDLRGAKRHGWVRRHYFKPWILIATTKGRFHTWEWMQKDDDVRAANAGIESGDMTLNEKRAAQVELVVRAWRLNEDSYQEAKRNLEEMGLDFKLPS